MAPSLEQYSVVNQKISITAYHKFGVVTRLTINSCDKTPFASIMKLQKTLKKIKILKDNA